jgi:hypothetical protein
MLKENFLGITLTLADYSAGGLFYPKTRARGR